MVLLKRIRVVYNLVFLLSILTVGISFSGAWKVPPPSLTSLGNFFIQPQEPSLPSTPRKRSILIVPYKPFLPETQEVRNLGKFIEELWWMWGQQSSSFIFSTYSNPLSSYSNRELKRVASLEQVDYLAYAVIDRKNGALFLTPILYSRREDVKFQSYPRMIPEYFGAEEIFSGFQSLLSLAQQNLPMKSEAKELAKGEGYFQEKFLPSLETAHEYLNLLNSQDKGKKVTPEEWENLAKREPFFWLPWRQYLVSRFRGKEDSWEARYALESLSRKLTSYHTLYLADIGLEFLKNLPKSTERYKSNSLFELTNAFFLSSGKTLRPEYAQFLNLYAEHLFYDKKWNEALSLLLQAQYIFHGLQKTKSQGYFQNQFLLAKAYRESNQPELASTILESLLEDSSLTGAPEGREEKIFQQILLYNLGCLNLDLHIPKKAWIYLQKLDEILIQEEQYFAPIRIQTKINRIAALLMEKKSNQAISLGIGLDKDLGILGLKGSEYDRMNAFNLSLAYSYKQAEYTSKQYYSYYEKITPYNQRKNPKNDETPLYFKDIFHPNSLPVSKDPLFSPYEEQLLRSITGKFKMEDHPLDVRSRTYKDRLEDQEIFLSELLGKFNSTHPKMEKLRKIMNLGSSYKSGKNILFIDIGPGLANPMEPAITSLSLLDQFPKMELVLLDLPSEVNLFFKSTPVELRKKILNYENVRIVAGDGVEPLKNHFLRKESWVLPGREIPSYRGKFLIIRAANSIDVYEPYPKVHSFLRSILEDFYQERVLVFFNRLILMKPSHSRKFQLIGTQSVRGFYHNEWSLDRKGQPPYVLSDFALGED